jgi:succinate dehydrogenase/fumarate reductase flavoprotein subunit
VAWEFAGVVRSRDGIREGLVKIDGIERALGESAAEDPAERIAREDMISAAFAVRTILEASLGREESRGTFIRSDFPLQDDLNGLKNSVCTCDETRGRVHVRFEEVMGD